jgi:hypothetical protein
MTPTVDISRDLKLLDRLKRRLRMVGVHAEVREHLMSLIVFPPIPALPICVFISGEGGFYSWNGGQSQQPVTDLEKAAEDIAMDAVSHVRQRPTRRGE